MLGAVEGFSAEEAPARDAASDRAKAPDSATDQASVPDTSADHAPASHRATDQPPAPTVAATLAASTVSTPARFRGLPRRTRLALMGAAGVVAVLLGAMLLHVRTPASATESGPVLDAASVVGDTDTITAQDILRDQRQARPRQLLETERQQPSVSQHVAESAPQSVVAVQQGGAKRPKETTVLGARATAVSESVAPATEGRRRKQLGGVISFYAGDEASAVEAPAWSKKTLGIPTGATAKAQLVAGLSSDASGTPAQAILPAGLLLSGTGLVLPKGTKVIGSASYQVQGDRGRVSLRFNKIVFPDHSERAIDAIAVTSSGQAGLLGRVTKRDGRTASNVGEAALDVVDTVRGDAPANRSTGRFAGDKRSDIRELRREDETVSIPANTAFNVQFVQPL